MTFLPLRGKHLTWANAILCQHPSFQVISLSTSLLHIYGVPQGSVLVALFIILYTTHLSTVISSSIYFALGINFLRVILRFLFRSMRLTFLPVSLTWNIRKPLAGCHQFFLRSTLLRLKSFSSVILYSLKKTQLFHHSSLERCHLWIALLLVTCESSLW